MRTKKRGESRRLLLNHPNGTVREDGRVGDDAAGLVAVRVGTRLDGPVDGVRVAVYLVVGLTVIVGEYGTIRGEPVVGGFTGDDHVLRVVGLCRIHDINLHVAFEPDVGRATVEIERVGLVGGNVAGERGFSRRGLAALYDDVILHVVLGGCVVVIDDDTVFTIVVTADDEFRAGRSRGVCRRQRATDDSGGRDSLLQEATPCRGGHFGHGSRTLTMRQLQTSY